MRLTPSFGTEYAKEMAKWEVKRPFAAYPKMMYRSAQLPNGKWTVHEISDSVFGGAPGTAERWTTNNCQLVVHSEEEERLMYDRGWRAEPRDAMDHRERMEKAIGDAAAERAYQDARMTEKAREEAKAFESEQFGHVAVIPEKKRMGRPPLSEKEKARRAQIGLINRKKPEPVEVPSVEAAPVEATEYKVEEKTD